ncbi:hypothetical protein AB0P17_04085 [Streptomyces sp. NPDC088124]|uniref:hypothetical protein n=1 Tax=Streptomyces sp. NPDC088124 TaxID=3154654 RepID=UPI003438B295
MTATLVLNDLAVPLRALRMLAVDFPDLPAVEAQMSPIYPNRLDLGLHDDLAAFEMWRTALGIPGEVVTFHQEPGGTSMWLNCRTEYAGADLHLTGFGRLPQTALTLNEVGS